MEQHFNKDFLFIYKIAICYILNLQDFCMPELLYIRLDLTNGSFVGIVYNVLTI